MTFLISSHLCTNKCHRQSIFGRNIQGEKLSCCPRGAGSWARQSAYLSISGSLAFLKVVGSCQTAHPKLLLNQKEKDAELPSMPGNSQRLQEPEQPQVCPAAAAGKCAVSKRCKHTPSPTHPEFSRAPHLTCCRAVKALGEIPVSPVVRVTEPSFS